jgi:hypothetical protein
VSRTPGEGIAHRARTLQARRTFRKRLLPWLGKNEVGCFFAGEACVAGGEGVTPMCVHTAMATGVRAAKEVAADVLLLAGAGTAKL